MAAWDSNVKTTYVAVICLLMSSTPPAFAEALSEVRFFKVNKKDQQTEYRLIRDRREPGCHSLRLARKLYRVQVIGFDHCEVFANAACEAGSELSFMWSGRKKSRNDVDTSKPQTKLPLGSRWLSHPERMTKFKSWRCGHAD